MAIIIIIVINIINCEIWCRHGGVAKDSSEIWHPVFGQVIRNVSKDLSAYFFRALFSERNSQGVSDPWNKGAKFLRITRIYLSIDTITSQKNLIFIIFIIIIIIIIIIVVVFVLVVATFIWAAKKRNRVWNFNMTEKIFSFLELKIFQI